MHNEKQALVERFASRYQSNIRKYRATSIAPVLAGMICFTSRDPVVFWVGIFSMLLTASCFWGIWKSKRRLRAALDGNFLLLYGTAEEVSASEVCFRAADGWTAWFPASCSMVAGQRLLLVRLDGEDLIFTPEIMGMKEEKHETDQRITGVPNPDTTGTASDPSVFPETF